MKSSLYASFLNKLALVVVLGMSISNPTAVEAGGSDLLFVGMVKSGTADYPSGSRQGYLQVYSATDEFDDGGVPYHAHSSYAIYTIDGKFFKNVENHISRSDEIPERVMLPAGSYTLEARSESGGYIRMRVSVKADRLTILDLDSRDRRAPAQ